MNDKKKQLKESSGVYIPRKELENGNALEDAVAYWAKEAYFNINECDIDIEGMDDGQIEDLCAYVADRFLNEDYIWGEINELLEDLLRKYSESYKKDKKENMKEDKQEDKPQTKLTEAPDEMGYATDDELEAEERAEFEKRLAQRKADRDQAKNQDIEKQKAKKAEEEKRQAYAEKGKELYNKAHDTYKDGIDSWFDFLVPASGKAETVAGEFVRAVCRIGYRWFNDGDKFFSDYGRETCGSSIAYLLDKLDEFEAIYDDEENNQIIESLDSLQGVSKRIYDIINYSSDEEYGKFIKDLEGGIQDFLMDNPALFSEPNEDDSRNDGMHNIDYFDLDEPRDYEYKIEFSYYENGDELNQYIVNGIIDIWDVQDYFKLPIEDCDEDAEIDTPWSQYDTEINVSNLTEAGYKKIDGYNWDAVISDYVDELRDKYGDPEDQEDEDDWDDESDYENEESEEDED